jgi:hypothetical protein
MGLIFVFMVLFIPGGLSEVLMKVRQRFFGKEENGGKSAAAEKGT